MAGRHVALLRGINVGTAKRVAMADLRSLVEGLGYCDVSTLLNSGNVVFTVPTKAAKASPAKRIEQALVDRLGVTSRVLVLSAAELAVIVAGNPLEKVATDPSRLFVAVVFDGSALAALKPLSKQDWGQDRLALGTRAAYLWCVDGMTESRLAKAANRTLGDAATTRNWATILKLDALMRSAPK